LASALLLAATVVFLPNSVLAQRSRRQKVRKPAANVRFENRRTSVTVSFEGENLIILLVRVNNSAPLKFLFDTGAGGSALNTLEANKLNLKKADDVDATGVGGSVQGYLAKGISLSIAGVKVLNQRIIVLPLDFPCELHDIAGIIGYDFINEFVTEIDYEAKTLSFSDPLTYRYTGRGDLLPLVMNENTPRLRARVQLSGAPPIEGLFEIDTGSDSALTINSPFIKKHGLLSLLGAKADSVHRGVGGEAKSVDARLLSIEIGRYVITDPLVTFSKASEGSHATEDNDGPLGNEILRRFRVVIDYSRRRLMLEPNSHVSDPIEADMSGLEFDPDDCGLCKVMKVAEDSPAAEAGIKPGDEIVAINGRPNAELTSWQIEKLLQRNGAEPSLTLNRAGKTLVVKIKLRRLL
jgi:hypothetical protein